MQSKSWDHQKFTVKHSRESKNTCKGRKLERDFSVFIHAKGFPVLVSSLLLRQIDCGQVDLCRYQNGQLIVYEVKSYPEGLTRIQRLRLHKSLSFLLIIFNAHGKLQLLNRLPKD